MINLLSIGSVAVFYSAWYMNISIFSFGWFAYCLTWIPLFIIFVSAYKYDNKNPQDVSESKMAQQSNRVMQK